MSLSDVADLSMSRYPSTVSLNKAVTFSATGRGSAVLRDLLTLIDDDNPVTHQGLPTLSAASKLWRLDRGFEIFLTFCCAYRYAAVMDVR